MVDYLYGITAATTDSEGRRFRIGGAKRWDFCDVSLEGEKPYHEWYGGYGWIGQFHTKLFSKMLFGVFLCQRKGCFLHRLI